MRSALAQAPAVTRVQNFDLTGTLQYQRDMIAQRKCLPFGRILNIQLGLDDNAQYCQGEAWQRVSKISKIQGLTLEWKNDEAPVAYWAEDKQTLLLPNGIQNLPTMVAQIFGPRIVRDNLKDTTELPRIPQRLSDYSSGRIMGRDGSGFLILQPVLQVIVLAFGVSTMINLKGSSLHNRWPFLMVSPKNHEAYLAGGRLAFD